MDLKATYARESPSRGPNLRGIVGKCRHIVADEGRRARKLAPSELHSITGVAGEENDNIICFFYWF